MATSNTPAKILRMHSDRIAHIMKDLEAGQPVKDGISSKIAASKASGVFRPLVAMDDKLVVIEIPWTTVRNLSESELSAFIFDLMQGGQAAKG